MSILGAGTGRKFEYLAMAAIRSMYEGGMNDQMEVNGLLHILGNGTSFRFSDC
jgi:hypothetical protein